MYEFINHKLLCIVSAVCFVAVVYCYYFYIFLA